MVLQSSKCYSGPYHGLTLLQKGMDPKLWIQHTCKCLVSFSLRSKELRADPFHVHHSLGPDHSRTAKKKCNPSEVLARTPDYSGDTVLTQAPIHRQLPYYEYHSMGCLIQTTALFSMRNWGLERCHILCRLMQRGKGQSWAVTQVGLSLRPCPLCSVFLVQIHFPFWFSK